MQQTNQQQQLKKKSNKKSTPIIFNENGLDINRVRIILPNIKTKSAFKAGNILYTNDNGFEVPLKMIIKDLYAPFGVGDYNGDKKFGVLFNLKKDNKTTLKLEKFLNDLQDKVITAIANDQEILKWWKVATKDKNDELKDIELLKDELVTYKWNPIIKEKELYCNQFKAKILLKKDTVLTQFKNGNDVVDLNIDNITSKMKGRRNYNIELQLDTLYLLSGKGGFRMIVQKAVTHDNDNDNEEEVWSILD